MLVEQFLPAFSIVSGIFVLAPVLFYAAPFVLLFLFLSYQGAPAVTHAQVVKPLAKLVADTTSVENLTNEPVMPVKTGIQELLYETKLKSWIPAFAGMTRKKQVFNKASITDLHCSSFSYNLRPTTYDLLPVFTASLPPRRVLRELHERAPPLKKATKATKAIDATKALEVLS